MCFSAIFLQQFLNVALVAFHQLGVGLLELFYSLLLNNAVHRLRQRATLDVGLSERETELLFLMVFLLIVHLISLFETVKKLGHGLSLLKFGFFVLEFESLLEGEAVE